MTARRLPFDNDHPCCGGERAERASTPLWPVGCRWHVHVGRVWCAGWRSSMALHHRGHLSVAKTAGFLGES